MADKPRWLVLNKMDLVPEDEREEVIAKYRREFGDETPIFPISAATREGCDTLVKAISEDLQQQRQMLIEDSEPVIDDFDEDEENAQKIEGDERK